MDSVVEVQSKYKIQALTMDHLPAATVLAVEGYRSDPVILALQGAVSNADRERLLHLYFGRLLLMGIRFGAPAVVTCGATLAGVASIYPAGSYPPPWPRAAKETLVLGASLKWAQARHYPKNDFNYMELCVASKKYSKQGVGSRLMDEFENYSSLNHKGMYLETTNPHSILFFENLGYQRVAEFTTGMLPCWSFWKNPGMGA